MRLFVMNLGSTSFKFKLYDSGTALADGHVESIGAAQSAYEISWVSGGGGEAAGHAPCPAHRDAFELCLRVLGEQGVGAGVDTLDAVAYKAVHGGAISGTCRVDDGVLAEMRRMIPFAPAHNPPYIAMMEAIRAAYPALPQVACFETAFHSTVPLARAVYGVPYDWVEELGIRRYGFHGASHEYIARTMAALEPGAKRIVSAHLGGSCSMCAIWDGKSVANSLGATLQSGLFHNNRVGDFEPFCLPALVAHTGSLEAALAALAEQSGFLGLSGVSNDMRLVEEAWAGGDERAGLAVKAFADQIVGYVGMYTAWLGGLDALVFTGGIGANGSLLRRMVCGALGFVNAKLDEAENEKRPQSTGGAGSAAARRISAPDSGIAIWAVKTDEEWVIARKAAELLGGG